MVRQAIKIALLTATSVYVANAAHGAGAYAVGQSERGSWGGGAINAANYADAARDALSHCGRHGPNCMIVAYFNHRCFSLAIPPGTGGYFWATRDTTSQADEVATTNCRSSGRFCELKVAFCDTRGIDVTLPASTQPAVSAVNPEPELPQRGFYLVVLVTGAMIAGVAIAPQNRSSPNQAGYELDQAAELYDREAERFRAMSRKLVAEAELADSLIKAKRTRAELDDIEGLFHS